LPIREQRSNLLPILAIWRDESSKDYDACIHEKSDHLADSANIFGPVLRTKGQVRTEPVADIVAIQHIGGAAFFMELLLHNMGNG
jgi:hypothetical protein